ncbi:pilus assembly protein, partial [Citrobacter sp. wls618]
DPNCKLPALQDAILKKHVLCSQQLINK